MAEELSDEVGKWMRKLNSETWEWRRDAARNLGDAGENAGDAIPELIEALTDKHWSVRSYAARALGRIGRADEDVVSALKEALNDEDWWVREKANEALITLGQSVESVEVITDEHEIALPDPVFLGFLPKKVASCAESWIGVPNVREICSVSQCISATPPGMFDSNKVWNLNRAGLYNDSGSAFNDIPPDERDECELFAYKAYNIELDDNGVREIDILEHLPGYPATINPKPDLSGFHRIGYDLVQEIGYLGFGCSPLSCNSLAGDVKVNEFCLIDDLHYAIEVGVKFEAIGAEPPPYYVFEVYRKRGGRPNA
jgi:hypothetical protein